VEPFKSVREGRGGEREKKRGNPLILSAAKRGAYVEVKGWEGKEKKSGGETEPAARVRISPQEVLHPERWGSALEQTIKKK